MGSTIQWPELHFYFHLRLQERKDSYFVWGLSALGGAYIEPVLKVC